MRAARRELIAHVHNRVVAEFYVTIMWYVANAYMYMYIYCVQTDRARVRTR